jgi:hypothetical protein
VSDIEEAMPAIELAEWQAFDKLEYEDWKLKHPEAGD